MNTKEIAYQALRLMTKMLISRDKQLKKSEDPELFSLYKTESLEVREYVNDLAQENDCDVVAGQEAIYLIPHEKNFRLVYTKAELRQELKCGSNEEQYGLSMMAILVLITIMYNGQSPATSKVREIIRPALWENELTKTLNKLGETNEQIRKLSETWQAKPNVESPNDFKRTKEYLLKCVMNFLEKEGLTLYHEESDTLEVRERLTILVDRYLLNVNNLGRLAAILKGEYQDA
jgi:hypothetical protein